MSEKALFVPVLNTFFVIQKRRRIMFRATNRLSLTEKSQLRKWFIVLTAVLSNLCWFG